MQWFVERVLPALLVAVLTAIGGWLWTSSEAFTNKMIEQLGQRWIPDGAVLFANGECPEQGWNKVGIVAIDHSGSDVEKKEIRGCWPH